MDSIRLSTVELGHGMVNTSSRSSEQSSRVGSQNAKLNQSGILDDVDCIAAERVVLELTFKEIRH